MVEPLRQLLAGVRWARKAAKARLPYVRRREYRLLSQRYAALAEAFTTGSRLASEAEVRMLAEPSPALSGEVCLFATYAATPELKPHVRAHIEASQGDAVRAVVPTRLLPPL